jgi:hypothetical protein
MTPEQDMQVRDILVNVYGENAIEACVGLLSTLVDDIQGDVLIRQLTQRHLYRSPKEEHHPQMVFYFDENSGS